MEDRIVELELRSMHQDAMLQELSAVLASQQQQLDRLQAELRLLQQKVQEPGLVDSQLNEPPPHY
jgi:uncharacterized coiled-coil protein SlyX